jgi:hypothetical protein
MAATPQFGGTNGVAELNLGQVGSARRAAGMAVYTLNVLEGDDEVSDVESHPRKQDVTFSEHLGWNGATVRWVGMIKVADSTELEAIRSELSVARYGRTITNGVRGAFDAARIAATRLTDSFGKILGESCRLRRAEFTGRVQTISATPGMTLQVPLTVEFRILV